MINHYFHFNIQKSFKIFLKIFFHVLRNNATQGANVGIFAQKLFVVNLVTW